MGEPTAPTTGTRDERRQTDRRRINYAGLLELLQHTDEKHDEAHKRLRESYRELDQRLDDGLRLLADKQHASNTRLTEMATTPVDVTKLVLTPRIVASVVAIVLAISGAMWAQNAGLRSDVRDILTRMDSEKRVTDANAKLLEVNSTTINRALENNARELKDAIAAVNKRQDLLTLQYNQLNDQLTRLTAQRER
jgi:hypothetical protein